MIGTGAFLARDTCKRRCNNDKQRKQVNKPLQLSRPEYSRKQWSMVKVLKLRAFALDWDFGEHC